MCGSHGVTRPGGTALNAGQAAGNMALGELWKKASRRMSACGGMIRNREKHGDGIGGDERGAGEEGFGHGMFSPIIVASPADKDRCSAGGSIRKHAVCYGFRMSEVLADRFDRLSQLRLARWNTARSPP